ncbi:UNVERIFIED_CONTAM: hypothetical protein GTU68_012563 [Idotea baltica]|nr:hypothetical protein [Idotea baltica]
MISVQNLRFTYPGSTEEVLQGLDFEVQRSEIFGFLGPSGSGKSTTQKILYKLLTQYQGQILIEGQELSSLKSDYLHRIGVGFELPNHYLKLTGRENLKLFSQFYHAEKLRPLDELFDLVGLLKDADRKVEDYSKGMKMRLNFIRALLHDPDLLFFDEPTSGMDPGNARLIKDCILDLREKGKAVFITTHNMFTADELCDRVAFLNEGKIVAQNHPRQFKLDHGSHKVRVELEGQTNASHEFPLDGIGDNNAFLEVLRSGSIKAIHTQEATLEQVFLKLTGKELK